ncbi:Uncharacterised protein [Salmonella enterica subsp. enterica]|uniref:Uncharacterized protein n=1 Tax=Salmonella enterica I TaxID=59201 RepID=A0A379WTZ4_SALET|nr:Uncharacterised protein [Salmonella enterica subsp. enterica]
MTRSNTADNCNIMDNMFSAFFSTQTHLHSTSFFLLIGEQHWRNATLVSHFCLSWRQCAVLTDFIF